MRYHIVISLAVIMLTLIVGKPVSAAGGKVPTVGEVMKATGYTDQDREALFAGKIISKDLKRVSDTQLIAAAAMIFPVQLDKIFEIYGEGRGLKIDPSIIAYGYLSVPFNEADWAKVGFDASEKEEIEKLLEAEPGLDINLSAEELEKLKNKAKGRDADDPEIIKAVSKAYKEILIGRFNSYIEQGLDGIMSYDRGDGETASPAEELRTAWDVENGFMASHFPRFTQAVSGYPKGQSPGITNEFYWIKQEIEGRPTFILNHYTLQKGPDFIASSKRQFFVGHTYNSQQTVSLLLPVQQGTAVFHANSTSTEHIAGFFGGIAVEVGQDRIKDEIEAYLKAAREHGR